MVVYYYEAESHAQTMIYYLQCQGHREGLAQYDYFYYIFSVAGPFATKLSFHNTAS